MCLPIGRQEHRVVFPLMSIHELFKIEHAELRDQAQQLRSLMAKETPKIAAFLPNFQVAIRKHFKREDVYYRALDEGKRVQDRDLMHTLRNDHAGVLFALESLTIRLRKGGFSPDWQKRCETMLDVLLPHMSHEESELFSKGNALLSQSELQSLLEQARTIE